MKNITISLSDGDYNKLEQVAGKEDLSIYGLVKSMILQKIVLEVEQFRYKNPKTIDKVMEEQLAEPNTDSKGEPIDLGKKIIFPVMPSQVKVASEILGGKFNMFCKTCSGVREFKDGKCIQCKTKAE